MAINGYLDVESDYEFPEGMQTDIHGIGAAVPGIPWYTYKGKALLGKVFTKNNLLTGMIVCDDPYWCEFEGVFE